MEETRSEIYVQYAMFVARYGVYRDLDTFDLRENVRLGPSLAVRAAYGGPEFGATYTTWPLSASASWAVGRAGGLALVSLGASTRFRENDDRFIDQHVQGRAYAASPMLRRLVRLVLDAEAQAVRADTQKTLYLLGGDTGLRGYAIGALSGTAVAAAHVELRSAPVAIMR